MVVDQALVIPMDRLEAIDGGAHVVDLLRLQNAPQQYEALLMHGLQ
jgi:hypothetical protein